MSEHNCKDDEHEPDMDYLIAIGISSSWGGEVRVNVKCKHCDMRGCVGVLFTDRVRWGLWK